jgi:hypothetical protein
VESEKLKFKRLRLSQLRIEPWVTQELDLKSLAADGQVEVIDMEAGGR